MQARTSTHPAMLVPGAMQALLRFGETAKDLGVDHSTLELASLRASQINGCSLCVHLHAQTLRKAGESDERIDTVAAWRESPWFSDAERAALALTEAVTRLADRPDPVDDSVWDAAAAHYDEVQLSALLVHVATTNVWNRLNAAVHQPAGALPV
jgi:AhpD family alkylhydroperoxidase